jgi:hypothetical protein
MPMIGCTLLFDDAPPVWREVPQVPSAGDALSYAGRAYRVEAVAWFGTENTWAAQARCARLPASKESP